MRIPLALLAVYFLNIVVANVNNKEFNPTFSFGGEQSLADQLREQGVGNKDDDTDSIQEDDELETSDRRSSPNNVYDFLYKRMKQDVIKKKKRPTPNIYSIPGPQEPLPGRSHIGDYWPVFPFQNQYSGGLDLDPSISRHIGGDFNLAVPSWGMLDIYGRFFNRISDTTTKFGYMNHPVNMMDLEKEDFVKLMSDPSLQYNRNNQPTLPLGKMAKSFVPISCKPPLCNPYHHTFALGVEHDYGGSDGVEGDIDVPLPISKGIAYRYPFSGKIYYDFENITITYGQNLAPVDPFTSLFEYQKYRDPALRIPRRAKRSIPYMQSESRKVWNQVPEAKTFGDHMEQAGRGAMHSSEYDPITSEIPLKHFKNPRMHTGSSAYRNPKLQAYMMPEYGEVYSTSPQMYLTPEMLSDPRMLREIQAYQQAQMVKQAYDAAMYSNQAQYYSNPQYVNMAPIPVVYGNTIRSSGNMGSRMRRSVQQPYVNIPMSMAMNNFNYAANFAQRRRTKRSYIVKGPDGYYLLRPKRRTPYQYVPYY